MMKSSLTGEYFDESDSIRIINPKQACYYWSRGIKPLSIYPSQDFKSGEPILVFLFSKTKTKEVYEEWKNQRP